MHVSNFITSAGLKNKDSHKFEKQTQLIPLLDFDFQTIQYFAYCIAFPLVMRTLFRSSLPSPNLFIIRTVVV